MSYLVGINCEEIEYDIRNNWIYANWIGFQNKETVLDGCEKILKALQQKNCTRILNDNRRVTSKWHESAEWVARDWFPRLYVAGCFYFAWIYSINPDYCLSVDETLLIKKAAVETLLFDDYETAVSWLDEIL
jgi:hypothetical protein